MQQKPRPPRICTYRGKLEDRPVEKFSRDHIVPCALFNALDPQLITVVACTTCQEEKGYGDDDLRDLVNLHWAGSQHPEAWQQQLKILSAILAGRSKIGRAMMTDRELKPLLSENGLDFGEVWEAPIPGENRDMFKTLDYIVRGLDRDKMNVPLPPTCPVSVAHIDTLEAREVPRLLTRIPHDEPTIKGHLVAWWVLFHVHEDPLAPLWVLMFNDSVYFLGGTGKLARKVEDG